MSDSAASHTNSETRDLAYFPLILAAILDIMLRGSIGTEARVALLMLGSATAVVVGYRADVGAPNWQLRLAGRSVAVSIVMLAIFFGVDRMAWGVYGLGVFVLGWLIVSTLARRPNTPNRANTLAGKDSQDSEQQTA